MTEESVTALLAAYRRGNPDALNRVLTLVYDELHRLAERHLSRERPDHTLQATALVNEAYLKLVGADVAWQDRAHFFAVSARVMRRILVDHARLRGRMRRGGTWRRISLDDAALVSPEQPSDLLALDEALNELLTLDEGCVPFLVEKQVMHRG